MLREARRVRQTGHRDGEYGPRNGEELGAPIFRPPRRSDGYKVDVICTATSGRLMKKGVAEQLVVKEGSPKSVTISSRTPTKRGWKFYCCSPNLDLFDMTKEDLIPECEGIVGGPPSDRGDHGRRCQGTDLLSARDGKPRWITAPPPAFRSISAIRYRSRRRSTGDDLEEIFADIQGEPALRPRTERLPELRHLHGDLPGRPLLRFQSARDRPASLDGESRRHLRTRCRKRSGLRPVLHLRRALPVRQQPRRPYHADARGRDQARHGIGEECAAPVQPGHAEADFDRQPAWRPT